MQVKFQRCAFAGAATLPPLKRVEEDTPVLESKKDTVEIAKSEPKKEGFISKSRELWKSTLKGYESIKAYKNGFFKGVKNAAIVGSALVGLDWMVTSGVHVSQGKAKLSEIFATPFVLVGKGFAKAGRFIVGSENYGNIFKRSIGKTLKMVVWDAPKQAFNALQKAKNVSRVAKWGFPIIAACAIGYTTFCSFLDANRAKADIDHAYGGKVGHH